NERPDLFIPASINRLRKYILPRKNREDAKKLVIIIDQIWKMEQPKDVQLEQTMEKAKVNANQVLLKLINTAMEMTKWEKFINFDYLDMVNKTTIDFLTVARWTADIKSKTRLKVWYTMRDLHQSLICK